jgi:2-dehydro-3-deoxyphosphooctonate aldolase (KDO 8-P synthase)
MQLSIPNIQEGSNSFFLLAGPCAVESFEILDETASLLQSICARLKIPFIFKSSYRKANRSKMDSFQSIGDDKALQILADIKSKYQVPIVTDVHESFEIKKVAQVADVLQIPAFLSRQTSLLEAAGKSGCYVNIKKGQFLGPEAMNFAAQKVAGTGNDRIMITERGTTFGYNDLVVDFRNIAKMRPFGYPIILDCTHSLQKPNQSSGVTGGNPELIEFLARVGIGAGVDGLFIETHPNPAKALSDGANMLPLTKIEGILEKLVTFKRSVSDIYPA